MARDPEAYTAELLRSARIQQRGRRWEGTLPALPKLRVIAASTDACRAKLEAAIRQELAEREQQGKRWPLLGIVVER